MKKIDIEVEYFSLTFKTKNLNSEISANFFFNFEKTSAKMLQGVRTILEISVVFLLCHTFLSNFQKLYLFVIHSNK